ncbi:hypothetical protein BDR06DRAFT_1019507 [Suillus hirtellus]|nr:hypothetical protein BDR06DRAFT_1019507 [Suillus hirtellus]
MHSPFSRKAPAFRIYNEEATPGEIERNTEQRFQTNAILYSTRRWGKYKGFIADFLTLKLASPCWIACGYPRPDIRGFLDATSSLSSGNKPFLDLIQSAMLQSDDHALKIQRAFRTFLFTLWPQPSTFIDDGLKLRTVNLGISCTEQLSNQPTPLHEPVTSRQRR